LESATLGGIFHKKMDVVIFAVGLHQSRLKVLTDAGKESP
jgi:hypothetical protein